MGIQAVVVFIGLVFALALGVVAGTWYASSPVAGWLAIGLVPLLWGLMHLVERVTGREIWHYTAPYPYSSMQVAGTKGETAARIHMVALRRMSHPSRFGVPREC